MPVLPHGPARRRSAARAARPVRKKTGGLARSVGRRVSNRSRPGRDGRRAEPDPLGFRLARESPLPDPAAPGGGPESPRADGCPWSFSNARPGNPGPGVLRIQGYSRHRRPILRPGHATICQTRRRRIQRAGKSLRDPGQADRQVLMPATSREGSQGKNGARPLSNFRLQATVQENSRVSAPRTQESTSSDPPRPEGLGIRSAPGPRGPGRPLGMSGSERGRPGGPEATQRPTTRLRPLSRTPRQPSARRLTGQGTQPTFPTVSKAVEPTCDPSKDPQTRPESPSRARWPGLNKAPPSQAWRGVKLRKEGPCNGPDLAKPGSRPTGCGDTRLLTFLLLAWPTLLSRRPESADLRQPPRVCRPERAAQTWYPEHSGGTRRPASSCALPRGGRGPRRLGSSEMETARSRGLHPMGSCRPVPGP